MGKRGQLLQGPLSPLSFSPAPRVWLKQPCSFPLFFRTPHPSQNTLARDLVIVPVTAVFMPRPGGFVQGTEQ